ncbi:hypothetical protein HAX54_043382 [Datura stramonium]|uniref:Uncharacterized protein n=1 Tax=Datura stramonium TaxID=4076 RepID=A0ABS8W2B8_DATST|nr:hypothetical protein [Datura stramonium]
MCNTNNYKHEELFRRMTLELLPSIHVFHCLSDLSIFPCSSSITINRLSTLLISILHYFFNINHYKIPVLNSHQNFFSFSVFSWWEVESREVLECNSC